MNGMKRSIGIERTYWLGDFRNLKVSDFISEIPDEIALDNNAMTLLRNLQMKQVDLAYLSYIKGKGHILESATAETVSEEQLDQIVDIIKKDRDMTYDAFIKAVENVEINVENLEEE